MKNKMLQSEKEEQNASKRNCKKNGFGVHFSLRVSNPLFYRCKCVAQQEQDMIVDFCCKAEGKSPPLRECAVTLEEAKLFFAMSWTNSLPAPLR